jgi:hypothetical protein
VDRRVSDRVGLVVLLVLLPLALIAVKIVAGRDLRTIDPYLPLYLLAVAVFVGGGLLVGFVFRWWGLLAAVGFACFLAYGLEFSSEGVFYAVIGGLVSCGAVVVGNLLRRKLR